MTMRLFLVRHGESVDNVAGLYAGSRDSPLTSHGVLQARRLGAHLATHFFSSPSSLAPSSLPGTSSQLRVFSSDLQRAYHTAQAIVDALPHCGSAAATASTAEGQQSIEVRAVPELRERDFRSSEGSKFRLSRSGPGQDRDDAETHAEMRVRADKFVDIYLAPLFAQFLYPSAIAAADATRFVDSGNSGLVIIVAHGVILSILLAPLLSRFGPSEPLEPLRLQKDGQGRLPSWSNTGYLEAEIWLGDHAATPSDIHMLVKSVNNIDHLRGLSRTRGGIGSTAFDSRQKTMHSFFKPAGGRSV